MGRRRFSTISVSVDVDVDDVMDEISDEELEAELKRRKVDVTNGERDMIAEAISAIRRGDAIEAITILERFAYPKWSAFDLSEQAFKAAIAAKAASKVQP